MFDFVLTLLAWIARLVFFTGRFLTADDFNQEQDYDREP